MSASPKVRHVLDAQQFGSAFLNELIISAQTMQGYIDRQDWEIAGRILANRLAYTLFFEPSTRTRMSFETAAHRLGMQVVVSENAADHSSRTKGELDEDAFRVLQSYQPDVIIVRHDRGSGLAGFAARSEIPIVSAGDGGEQHPTQALLDIYTIKTELGRLDNLHVVMVGDLAHYRAARSLALLLAAFPNNHLTFVAPPGLNMGDDVTTYLTNHHTTFTEETDLHKALPSADLVYVTRIQAERLQATPSELQRTYNQAASRYRVTPRELDVMRRDAIVMHPLPRVGEGARARVKTSDGVTAIQLINELDPACDADPRAAYFRQAANGLPVRMALLQWVVAGKL